MITKNKIICDDVLDGLRSIPDNIASLVFYSPPYDCNLSGYGYHDDNLPWNDYIDWLKNINTECNRILRTGGRLAINIDAITNRQSDKDTEYIRPIHYYLCKMMKEIGLMFYTELIWVKQNAVGKDSAWGSYTSCSHPVVRRNTEYIFVWAKNQFTLPGDLEQSDMTPEEFHLYTLSAWYIQPQTKAKAGHPAAFPEELVKRMVKFFTYRGDLVVDPFSGTGTTATVAYGLDREYIGIDNNPDFCAFARSRIADAEQHKMLTADYVLRSQRLKEVKQRKTEKESLQTLDL